MFLYTLDVIVGLFIFGQLLFLYQMAINCRYALRKGNKPRTNYRPRTALIIPCKGIDETFDINITSAYYQDYQNFSLYFVVEDAADSAYSHLCRLKEKLSASSKAKEVSVLIAGHASASSQKIHNLLHCVRQLPADIEVIAFADSDACLRTDWLSHLVYPLRQDKTGVATGYRWFIPQRNNFATLTLSAVNARVAQLLGSYRFNQAWGGSMAIRKSLFEQLEVEKVWSGSASDDYVLSYLVKRAKKKIAYIPACLVGSYERTTWPAFFEFARRQFVITRVTMLRTWLFSVFATVFSNTCFYAFTALAIYFAIVDSPKAALIAALVPVTFLFSNMVLACMRQYMITRLLPNEAGKLKTARIFDILTGPLLSAILFVVIMSSAFGRKIKWRGIEYVLAGPTKTIKLTKPD